MQELKGIESTQKDQQSQLTWALGFSESETQTKEHTESGPMPLHSHVVDAQLGLHVGPEQL